MLPAARFKAGSVRAFLRQKMNKTVTQAVPSDANGKATQLTSFVSDGTYPATVTSNALVVVGAGVANLAATVTHNAGLAAASAQLRKNGVSIGSVSLPSSAGTRTISVTGHTLAAGDLLTLWHISAYNGTNSISAATVDVVPA